MTGTNCKNYWSWILISPSLTLSISCQSGLPITVPVHSPSVNSTPNYLIPILSFVLLFCTPVSLLAHHHLHIFNSQRLISKMSPLWPINLTTFAHTLHRLFYCVIYCTCVYPMCNSMLLFLSHCFDLSWPGRSCKSEHKVSTRCQKRSIGLLANVD